MVVVLNGLHTEGWPIGCPNSVQLGTENRPYSMEALTACSVALLTIYDMCKAVDRGMVLEGVRLMEKREGKSGVFISGRSDSLWSDKAK